MADFIDYYSEFDIDRTADCNEIRNLLGNLEADYLNQRAICMTSDEIDVLQKLLDLIDGAIYNLTNEERRKKYDKKLEQMAASGMLTKEQSTAKSDYDQAVLCEKKGKIKDAVMFSERAIRRNIYNQDAYALLIRCYYKLGDYDKAIKIAERKAVRIYPDEPIFRQYCARIRTVGGDYEGSKIHIDEILRRNSNSSEGNIEEAVRLLYMSEDDNFTNVQKNQYLNEAQTKIDSYLSSHSNDNQYRSGVATALVGLTKKYYSRYEGVESLIIDSAHDYNSILSFYQWAHKLSDDSKITEAYEDIINQGKRKFNSDNSRSLMFMSGTALLYLYVFLTMLSSVDTDTETVIAVLITALFFVVPWFLLIKVSFRPQWKIDKIDINKSDADKLNPRYPTGFETGADKGFPKQKETADSDEESKNENDTDKEITEQTENKEQKKENKEDEDENNDELGMWTGGGKTVSEEGKPGIDEYVIDQIDVNEVNISVSVIYLKKDN